MGEDFLLFIESLKEFDDYRLPQRAYHIVRLAIRDLILPPGKTILEREMAEVLQMSRTPVREALVRLETEGMVRLIPRRGFIVEPIEREDLKEIYEIVETLDGLAVSLATAKVGEVELDKLESLIVQQEEALEQKDLKKWAALDDQFHHLIIDYADNKRLRTVIDSHSDQLYRARLFTINHRPIPLRSIVEHKAIISCMKAKDSNAAGILMESHRNRARNEILTAVEKIDSNTK
ncbi:GntR family transcriptional regulator [Bacillus sp. SA1-12]|nr:GntR family transcriptional regulator [Bacillus sp. SA1-12]